MSDFRFVSVMPDDSIRIEPRIVNSVNRTLRLFKKLQFEFGDAHLAVMILAQMMNERAPLTDEAMTNIRRIALQITKEEKTDD